MTGPARPPISGAPANPRGRRRDMTSEISTNTDIGSRSASLALAIQDNLDLAAKLEKEATSHTREEALQRLLSLRSVISTKSAFAEREQAAVGKAVSFRMIGKGSIAIVYEHPGTTRCYKLPLLDDRAKLWNNYFVQLCVQEAFNHASNVIEDLDVEIPQMFWYANKDTSAFWADNLDKFPFTDQYQKKTRDALCMERILPIPKPLRDLFVDKYCSGDEEDKAQAKAYQPNQDCLVRPLLGRRRRESDAPRLLKSFSLRNYCLHLDQFEQLKINIEEYVHAMADAMAILHGQAKIDAMDIEFVIGSAPIDMRASKTPLTSTEVRALVPGTSTFEKVDAKDFTHRTLCLWVLDFDACKRINIDQAGCSAALKAFIETEVYCPRPSGNKDDQKLWIVFGNRYLKTMIALQVTDQFGKFFLNGVESTLRNRQATAMSAALTSGQALTSSTVADPRGGGEQLRSGRRQALRGGGQARGGDGRPRNLMRNWRDRS